MFKEQILLQYSVNLWRTAVRSRSEKYAAATVKTFYNP
jgi:hypothetical protein